MRKCSKCFKNLSVTHFFKRKDWGDGYRRECKKCCQKRIKKWYQTPKGKISVINSQKRYWKTTKGKISQKKGSFKYYWNNLEKRSAKMAVWNAIKRKKIPPIKKQFCKECGNPAKHYHHHKGYTSEFKLTVIPLCTFCHKKYHRLLELPDTPGK